MRRVLIFVLTIWFMVGTAAAGGLDITILPESGPNVAPDGTIIVPLGADAYDSVGLAVKFEGFAAGNPYSIHFVDKNAVPVFTQAGNLPTGNDIIPVHWVVPNVITTYTVIATGVGVTALRQKMTTTLAPIPPAPELSTVALMSAGMIGLFGLVRTQRRE